MIRVLVSCEFSGVVRRSFAAAGIEAWSCDLLPSSDGGGHESHEAALRQMRAINRKDR